MVRHGFYDALQASESLVLSDNEVLAAQLEQLFKTSLLLLMTTTRDLRSIAQFDALRVVLSIAKAEGSAVHLPKTFERLPTPTFPASQPIATKCLVPLGVNEVFNGKAACGAGNHESAKTTETI